MYQSVRNKYEKREDYYLLIERQHARNKKTKKYIYILVEKRIL